MTQYICKRCKSLMIFSSSEVYRCSCTIWWLCDNKLYLWKKFNREIDEWVPVQYEEYPIKLSKFIFR